MGKVTLHQQSITQLSPMRQCVVEISNKTEQFGKPVQICNNSINSKTVLAEENDLICFFQAVCGRLCGHEYSVSCGEEHTLAW